MNPYSLLQAPGSPWTSARTRANHEYLAPVIHGSVIGTVATAAFGLALHTIAFSANDLLVESWNSYRRAPGMCVHEKAGVRGNV